MPLRWIEVRWAKAGRELGGRCGGSMVVVLSGGGDWDPRLVVIAALQC